ncbi:MAG TPA: YciI family protein [Gaiellaceae bacterium]|nr:YciI family protein [Gaiellaceae bacterium]
MKYALLIYNREGCTSKEMTDDERRRFVEVVDEVLARPNVGPWVRLGETESATTVRQGERGTFLTDGPFVDSKEFIAGLIVVDAANLDQALAVAAELQELRTGGAIEVRPMREARPSED